VMGVTCGPVASARDGRSSPLLPTSTEGLPAPVPTPPMGSDGPTSGATAGRLRLAHDGTA
jgi:hypothetical protein